MKKLLALVLALVMTLGLATVGTNATIDTKLKDADAIDEKYAEAVDVLKAIDVMVGDNEGNFRPTDKLTRAEGAKIVTYLIATNKVAENLTGIGTKFSDVPANHWCSGMIEYCAANKIIDGVGDGKFAPNDGLTVVAFAKMMLTALGYSSSDEGFVGSDWMTHVMTKASLAGVMNGLKELKATDPINRQQAAQMAFNTIKTPMVSYPNKSTMISNNGDTWTMGATAVYLTTVDNTGRYTRIGRVKDNTNQQANIVEFAEEYYPGLRVDADSDPFGRPANKWTYNNQLVGSFINTDYLVDSWNSVVYGADLYNDLGETAIKNSTLTYKVDGVVTNNVIEKENMVRSNNVIEYLTTGDGVLTELYFINGIETSEIIVVTINTYFATAAADYNKDREELRSYVYDNGNSRGYTVYDIDADVVPYVVDAKKGDAMLVNINFADGEVVAAKAPTAKSTGVSFKEYSNGGWYHIPTDGEKTYWDYNVSLYGTNLDTYNKSALASTYTVYMNGEFAIAIRPETAAKNYVFIAGFDTPASNIAFSNITANAIFLDGTMKAITVNVANTDKNIGTTAQYEKFTAVSGNAAKMGRYNQWFTYTETDGVYTLSPIAGSRVGAINTPSGADKVIKTAQVRLVSDADTTKAGYGNDNTKYITVNANANDKGQDVISRVTGTYTGVQTVEVKLYDAATTDKAADKLGANAGTANGFKPVAAVWGDHSVFFCYNSEDYLIGVIALGYDQASTKNYAFAIGTAQKEYTDGKYYYWDFNAIVNGELKTLTIKGSNYDKVMSDAAKIQDAAKYVLYNGTGAWKDSDGVARTTTSALFYMEFDKDNYVKEVQRVDLTNATGGIALGKVFTNKTYTDLGGANADLTTYTAYDRTYMDDTNPITLHRTGNTLYAYDNANGNETVGVPVKKDAKVFVRQWVYDAASTLTYGETLTFDSIQDALNTMADFDGDPTNGVQFVGEISAAVNKDTGVAQWLVLKTAAYRGIKSTNNNMNNNSNSSIGLNLTANTMTVNGFTAVNSMTFDVGANLVGNKTIKVYEVLDNGTSKFLTSWTTTIAQYNNAVNFTPVAGHTYYIEIDGRVSNQSMR